jgi:hypothetical protein
LTAARRVSVSSALTVVCHVPFALAAAAGARLAGLPRPGVVGASIAAALAAVFLLRLATEPYFAHWCAAVGSSVPIVVYWIAAGEPPFRFALGAYLCFLLLSAWGVFVRRRWVVVRRIEIPIADLAPELDGYRIVHMSDLHIGGLTPPAWAERWVRIANEARPDLVAITGDLVRRDTALHAAAADAIAGLSARDGVFVSLGNHDGDQIAARVRERNVVVLCNEGRRCAGLYVAGVDGTSEGKADLGRALSSRDAGVPTVLLAHDPALFPEAARAGVDLVLSGHTHGGQVAICPHAVGHASRGPLDAARERGARNHRPADPAGRGS